MDIEEREQDFAMLRCMNQLANRKLCETFNILIVDQIIKDPLFHHSLSREFGTTSDEALTNLMRTQFHGELTLIDSLSWEPTLGHGQQRWEFAMSLRLPKIQFKPAEDFFVVHGYTNLTRVNGQYYRVEVPDYALHKKTTLTKIGGNIYSPRQLNAMVSVNPIITPQLVVCNEQRHNLQVFSDGSRPLNITRDGKIRKILKNQRVVTMSRSGDWLIETENEVSRCLIERDGTHHHDYSFS